MALPSTYKGLEATKLHQKDFLPKYKELKADLSNKHPLLSNQKIHRKVYEKLGYPHWHTETGAAGKPGTKDFEPYLINQGKPRVAGTRQTSNAMASGKRAIYENLSNAHLTPEQNKAWNEYRDSLPKKFQLDHKREIQETGPEIETLNKWKKKGWISKKDYDRGIKKIREIGAGNDLTLNAQSLSEQENSAKRTEVIKKNKSLENLERRKLSSRFNLGKFKNKTFEQIYASVKDALKVNGNGNGNGNGLKINGGKTQSGALAIERTNPALGLVQKGANLAQLGMRNLSLLNMISEGLTKKKFTSHVGDTFNRGVNNLMLSINNPEQRAKDIAEQQKVLKSKNDLIKIAKNKYDKAVDKVKISTL